MAAKTVTRIAAITATIGIAGLPLTVIAPASAINKHEPLRMPSHQIHPFFPRPSRRNLDLARRA